MVYDVDEGVAVKGVRLVTHLVRAGEMEQDKVLFPDCLTPRCASACIMGRRVGTSCASGCAAQPQSTRCSMGITLPSLIRRDLSQGLMRMAFQRGVPSCGSSVHMMQGVVEEGTPPARCARCTGCWWTRARRSATPRPSLRPACWRSRARASSRRCCHPATRPCLPAPFTSCKRQARALLWLESTNAKTYHHSSLLSARGGSSARVSQSIGLPCSQSALTPAYALWLRQSPSKGRRGKGTAAAAAAPQPAQLQLAGVLRIMQLLGAPPPAGADSAAEGTQQSPPGASPGGGRRARASAAAARDAERPLHPELVANIVDGLFDQCAPLSPVPAVEPWDCLLPGVRCVWLPLVNGGCPRSQRLTAWVLTGKCPAALVLRFLKLCSAARSVPALRDWGAMAAALADDAGSEARGDAATTNLAALLAASVRRATAGAHAAPPPDARCADH